MKALLAILLLALSLPAFGSGKRPAEPKCDTAEQRILHRFAQDELDKELLWSGVKPTQMSKPEKPCEPTGAWIWKNTNISIDSKPPAVKPKVDTTKIWLQGFDMGREWQAEYLNQYKPEFDSLTSLWAAFIKGQIKPCPKSIMGEWWTYVIFVIVGAISALIGSGAFFGPKRRRR